jgi:hypothetical protein
MQENDMPKWENQGSKPSKKGKEKDTVGWTDGINLASVGAIVRRVGTQGETLGTFRWTVGPIFSIFGRVAEEEQRRQ